MAISSIQPISDFSVILPATAVAPAQLVSIATEAVTAPSMSTIVTLGKTEPLTQPLFNSAGQLESPDSFSAPTSIGETPQSQALAGELQADLSFNASGADGAALLAALNNAAQGTNAATLANNAGFSGLALDMNVLNAAGLMSSATPANTDFNSVLGANVELAVAGIGTGANGANALGTAGNNAAGVNALLATPTATTPNGAIGTTTPTTTTPITAPPATAPAAIAPTVAAPAAVAPTVAAPTVAAPPATALPAIAPTPTTPTTPATGTIGTATATATTTPAAGTTVAAPGTSAASVLQALIADAAGRAVTNMTDPGFASTSAGLFISASVFRAANEPIALGVGTADVAANPPPEVTAVQPARAA